MAKRFQWLGVKQPETVVEKTSTPSPIARVPKLVQLSGRKRLTPPAPARPQLHSFDAAQVKFQQNQSVQPNLASDIASRSEGASNATKLDKQPELSQGFGGKVIFVQPSPNPVVAASIVDNPELIADWGGFATVSEPSPLDVISTVSRGYPEVIRSWGGMVMMPLYWLDLPPDYEPPTAHSKWAVAPKNKWTAKPKVRFHLYVEGVLQ